MQRLNYLLLAVLLHLTVKHLHAETTCNTIQSDTLCLERKNSLDAFHFSGHVIVDGEDLHATCEQMDLFADKNESATPYHSSFGNIHRIISEKDVVIHQTDQISKADHAEIIPVEEKIILTGNASITNKEGVVEGHRITLYQTDQKMIVEGSPSGARATVTLPTSNSSAPLQHDAVSQESPDTP